MRLIRFRRKRERTRFRDELRIIPKWLMWTCITVYVVGLIIGLGVNLANFGNGGPVFPGDETLRHDPILSCLGLAGAITGGMLVASFFFFILGYVYRDAKRREMNPALWTLLVLLLAGPYTFIGLIVYLLIRDPLPYTCPQCSATVSARFNFCPNCKCNLRPACPQCQHEVADTDRFCAYCAAELAPSKAPSTAAPTDSAS
jgi:amino acid transporter